MKHNFGLGLIVKNLDQVKSLKAFLENGKKYGYVPKAVIIAVGEPSSEAVIAPLKKLCNLVVLPLYEKENSMALELLKMGASLDCVETLLVSAKPGQTLIPYGQNRNQVLMKAMLLGLEALVFIDYDVYPYRLVRKEQGIEIEEVNFFEAHLSHLNMPNVAVTSSDYTGYYIVPFMPKEHSEVFLSGLQKGPEQGTLVTQNPSEAAMVRTTTKVLGGNMALKLRSFERILPFFSTVYEVRGVTYLTRGEDTLLSLQMKDNEGFECLDIDLKIFHDTFGDYPKVPVLEDSEVLKNRFFYACMGWIGRNPFMNWLTGQDYEAQYKTQRTILEETAPQMAKQLNDERFLLLPEAIDAAYEALPHTIEAYHRFSESWIKWIKAKKTAT